VVEDVNVTLGVPFTRAVSLAMDLAAMLVDIKRMVNGGFDVLVDL
jgi:hypothetical protein